MPVLTNMMQLAQAKNEDDCDVILATPWDYSTNRLYDVDSNNRVVSFKYNYSHMSNYYSKVRIISAPRCSIIGSSAFSSVSTLTSIFAPACRSIGYGAFYECTSLRMASFPACKSISGFAFYSCHALQIADFPACEETDNYAFVRCTALHSVNFPKCSFFAGTFGSCTSLETASFPSCKTLNGYVFADCTKLRSVYFLGPYYINVTSSGAFDRTPITKSSYIGTFGSIYFPSSMLAYYKTATNWTLWSSRMVGV